MTLFESAEANERTRRDRRMPPWRVPSILSIVVLGVDVMSMKLLSGRTTRGTITIAVSRIPSWIFERRWSRYVMLNDGPDFVFLLRKRAKS